MSLDGNGELAPKQMEVKITEVSRRRPTTWKRAWL